LFPTYWNVIQTFGNFSAFFFNICQYKTPKNASHFLKKHSKIFTKWQNFATLKATATNCFRAEANLIWRQLQIVVTLTTHSSVQCPTQISNKKKSLRSESQKRSWKCERSVGAWKQLSNQIVWGKQLQIGQGEHNKT